MHASDYIYLARRLAGLTQAALAERAGMTQGEISRLESGGVRTSFETVRNLVRACGFEMDVSLARADHSYTATIGERLTLPPADRVARGLRHARQLQSLRRAGTLEAN